MAAINPYQLATDSTDTWIDYNASLDYTPSEYCDMWNNFFTFENHPQLPFYDTPQRPIFNGTCHKKVQTKRRILEYQAKY